jgi:hypothetical protein
MSRRSLLPLLLLLFVPGLLISKQPVMSAELIDFDWRGDDLVLVFSDSVGYQVDLAESDTAHVVVRFRNVVISDRVRQSAAGAEAPVGAVSISIGSRGGRTAAITPVARNEASLRVHDDERLGYSLEWRPYTRQLVVHTFDWDRLSYGESQYHQGLIALEQGVFDQAEELLQVAGASGESRANGVLASLYARRGADSLAKYFLRDPGSAEEYAALAAVQQRSGDSTAADESQARSERMLASGADRPGRSNRGRMGGNAGGGPSSGDAPDRGFRQSDVVLLAAVGGLALLLIIGLVVLASRRDRIVTPAPTAPVPPAPRRSDAPGFRVVDRTSESIQPEPPVADPLVPRSSVVDETSAHADDVALVAGSSRPADAPITPATRPSTWASTTERRSASQADEVRDRMKHSETQPAAGESTIAAARRLQVSRDNIELRRRMDAAAGRETNVPD